LHLRGWERERVSERGREGEGGRKRKKQGGGEREREFEDVRHRNMMVVLQLHTSDIWGGYGQ